MNAWCWLNTNSGALQSLVAILGAVLTVITIFVLLVTWRAIKRQAIASELQADAARALILVADEQTKASKDAAASAKTQCDLLSSQLELSTAPLLVAEPDDRANMKNYKLVNRGQGMAFQVYYWHGGLAKKDQGAVPIKTVQPSTLAPGASVYVPIPPGWDSWTVRYKGIDRQERWTIVYRDESKGQEHVMRRGPQEVYLA
jgi:hypothetical protein